MLNSQAGKSCKAKIYERLVHICIERIEQSQSEFVRGQSQFCLHGKCDCEKENSCMGFSLCGNVRDHSAYTKRPFFAPIVRQSFAQQSRMR